MDYAFKNAAFAKEFNRRSPNRDSWMTFSIGSSACYISVSQIRKRGVAVVELYIPDDDDLISSSFPIVTMNCPSALCGIILLSESIPFY